MIDGEYVFNPTAEQREKSEMAVTVASTAQKVTMIEAGAKEVSEDVVFDGIQSAKAKGSDLIIIDTAGRLHNKTNLMNELNKISRIVDRELPDSAKEVLLVLDGTTGQNGLIQAKQFKEIAGVTCLALTKLDGTAKGGVVLSIKRELGFPVKFIGVGEQIDDMKPFDAEEYVKALFENDAE